MKNTSLLLSPYILPLRRVIYAMLGMVDRMMNRSTPDAFVLCYHSAGNVGNRFSMSADTIYEQIDYLKKHFAIISLADMCDVLAGKKSYEKPVVAITFDDGYESMLALRDLPHRIGAAPTVFVLSSPDQANRTELMSNEKLMTHEQVRELHSAGWDIGCHSATHADFSSLPKEEARREIIDAKQELEMSVGASVSFFAYPKGVYTEMLVPFVQQAQFRAGFSMDDDIVTKESPMYTLPRIGVDATHTMKDFAVLWSLSNIWFRKYIKQLFSL